MKRSLRKNPPDPAVFESRRAWGSRLRTELAALGKKPEWLGTEVGYKIPGSIRQVMNGHHGISREIYDSILALVPEMKKRPPPPMQRIRKGLGAYGEHKKHDYPKLGPKAPHLPKRSKKGKANARNSNSHR